MPLAWMDSPGDIIAPYKHTGRMDSPRASFGLSPARPVFRCIGRFIPSFHFGSVKLTFACQAPAGSERSTSVNTTARLLFILLILWIIATPGAARGDQNTSTNPPVAVSAIGQRPFFVEWPAEGQFPADVSFLLPTPAGKAGFIRAKDGHLVLPDGARFRIWGLNATMQAGLPSKEHAPVVAANLARRGVNCIRFHFLDRLAPVGLIAADRNDTRALDAQQLVRLDFFIAELKQRGIYSDLNLNVGRTYKAGDAVREFEWLGFHKGLTYFDERLIELQKEYAAQLLTHTNAYTGKAYRDEPAVALVEFVNENSLVEAWFSDRLLGQQTNRPAGTWHDIPPSYAAALTAKYNAWLNQRLSPESLARLRAEAGVGAGELVPRLHRDQFEKASNERFQAEAGFYMEVEREFFRMMSRYLREELGVKALLIGNSDHNHGRSGYPMVASASVLDVVDGHVYWQHPNYRTDPKTGRQTGFDIPNTAMVDDPLHSTVVQLSRSAVAGKPYTVSEVNHPFPNEYACEGVPILSAYAAFQDWDGIFWYTLAHKDVLGLEPVVAGHFDFAEDPIKLSQLAAGALLFLRGDARPAARTMARSYSAEQVRQSIRLPWREQPYFTPGFPLALALQHAVRVSSFEGPPTGSFDASTASPIQSDTGELTWQCAGNASGLVGVNTPRSQALIGYCGGRRPATENLEAGVNVPFCAITVCSLDGKAIADADRLLVTATARGTNSGMEWNDRRTSLTAWGRPPTCIEPVTGELVLKNLRPARNVSVQPLDGAGRPLGGAIRARQSGQGWAFGLGEPATTWFTVTLGR